MFRLAARRLQIRTIAARRPLSKSHVAQLLSTEFGLEKQWAERLARLREFQMGGSYEWIASVEKKFVGDGRASAIDVDAAVCIAEEPDQVDGVVDLVYRLRHTPNTAETLPSTPYALLRLLLKHNHIDKIFEILDDPINYGIFLNDHAYCLLLDALLEKAEFGAAARVASAVMQQEQFENELLNQLCVYSLVKFAELPVEQRIFPSAQSVEDEDEEAEELTFRFPYLRNEFNDNHFDLTEPAQLVAKSLIWFGHHLHPELGQSLQLISAIVSQEAEKVNVLLGQKALKPQAISLAKSLVSEKVGENEKSEGESAGKETTEAGEETAVKEETLDNEWVEIKNKLDAISTASDVEKFSDLILSSLKTNQKQLEQSLMDSQVAEFREWNERRKQLIHNQAEKVELNLRLKEIEAQKRALRDELELLAFFDNRVSWEDQAKAKRDLFHEFGLDREDENVTEEVYGRTMFDRVRDERRMAKHEKKV